jgi:hypothetical protein
MSFTVSLKETNIAIFTVVTNQTKVLQSILEIGNTKE